MNKLLERQGDAVDITVTVGHAEESGEVELTLIYAGEPHNPLEGDADDLALMIVRNLTKRRDCSYENGKNRLGLTL